MSNFLLRLDTTPPQGIVVTIDGGAPATADRDVVVTVTTTDGDPTGYQVLLYGDVDAAFDPDVQPLEGDATWQAFGTPFDVRLSVGEEQKTVRVKVRDDVHNVTAEFTATITFLIRPVVTITAGPTPAKISKQPTKRVSTFSFSADEDIQAWKVKVVANAGATEDTGTQIGVVNGSTNMTGGAVAASTPVDATIDGADLELAGVEGDNRVKVFVQDTAGNWSL